MGRGAMANFLDAEFEKAAAEATRLSEEPDSATKLRLYALYKQGKEGDCARPRPGMTDFVGKAKHDAWTALKGLSQDEAKQAYITLVKELKQANE